MYYSLFFVFVISLLSFNSTAKEKLPPLYIYSNTPEISLMTISPDGSRIAYKSSESGQETLLIKEIATGKLLGGAVLEGVNARDAYFIDNFRVILRASEYTKINRINRKLVVGAAFIYDLRTKEIRQLLIPGYGIYSGQTNVGKIVGLSPDKKYAYMPAYYNDIKGFQVSNMGDGIPYTLTKVALDKKKRPRRLRIGNDDSVDFFIDAQGNKLARESYNERTGLHVVESYINEQWNTIFSEQTPFRHHGFHGVTPDRKFLIVTMTGDNGRTQYFTMSLANGEISKPNFIKENADIERVLSDIQRVVYGFQYSGFKPSYAFFDQKLTNKFNAIQKALPKNSLTMVDHTPDWSRILFKIEGGVKAGEYILLNKNNFIFLTSSRINLAPEDIHLVEEYSYSARDGLQIPTLLTYPKASKSTQKLPAVVMPHGGPEAYDRIQFDWLAQYLASRGVLVIQPQFRGSEGFGNDFLKKGRGEWGKKIQDDITDAVLSLTKEGVIDSERVCIMGWSYGGYAALAGATFTPDLYKCAISINGLSDIENMLDFEINQHGRKSETYRYWNTVINNKGLDKKFLKSISPINYVEKVKIPVLLIHGERDRVVDFEQSEDFYDELSSAKKDVKLVKIKDEGHNFIKNESRFKTLSEIDEFLGKHLF